MEQPKDKHEARARLFWQKNSFFLPIILSLLCLLLISLFYTIYNYLHSARAIEKNIISYSRQISDNVKTQVEDALNAAVQTLSHLAYEGRVQKYAQRSAMAGPTELLEVQAIMLYMGQIPLSYKQVSDSFIYFKNSNSIISSRGYFTPEEYFTKLADYSLSPEEWAELTAEYHSIDILVAQESNRPVLLLKSSPTTQRVASDVLVGVFLSEVELQKILQEFSALEASVAIISTKGEIVAHSKDFPATQELTHYSQQEDFKTLDHITLDGISYLIQIKNSTVGRWSYIALFPSQLILRDIANFRMMAIIMILLLLAVFFILVSYLRHKSYNPVKLLLNTVSENGLTKEGESGDAIQLIHSTIDRLRKERESIQDNLLKQHPIIYNNVLSSILAEIPLGDVEQKLGTINLSFAHAGFMVLYLRLEDSEKTTFLHRKEERALLKTVIINIAEDVFRSMGDIFPVEISWDELALILNSSLLPKKMEEDALACAQELLRLLDALFAVSVTVGASAYAHNAEELHFMYQTAQAAQSRKILTGINTVNRYTEQSSPGAGSYFYPIHIEHKLISSVTCGNEEEAIRLVETIFNQNFGQEDLPTPYLECLFYDIVNTGLKLLSELNANPADVFGSEDLERELLQSRTVKEAKENITRIIRAISAYINKTVQGKNEPLLENIITYIENHHHDNTICIASIAEAAGITESYLCHYFKEQTDTTVMRHVEHLRLEHVKKLLLNTEHTLSEIAVQTGFSNSSVLIRTFKKRVGVTPNEYRADRLGFSQE